MQLTAGMQQAAVYLKATRAECPELDELLTALGGRLAPGELVLKHAWEKREKTVAACSHQRIEYLELEALLSEVNAAIDDFLVAASGRSSRAGEEQQPPGSAVPMQCNPGVYESLRRSLAMAGASQRLSLPHASTAASTHRTRPSEAAGVGGLHSTMLGLVPKDVLSQARDGSSRAVHVIPELEQRLFQRCRRLREMLVEFSASGAEEEEEEQEEPAAAVASRAAALETLRSEDAETQLLCAELCASCLRDREALSEALKELLEAHKLGSNRKMLEGQAGYLEAQCRALLSKIEALQGQVVSKTYTADNVRALHAAAGHIQGREQEVQGRLDKVQKKLREYQEHEEELRPLAEEAAALQEKTADANYALEQLRAVERFTAAQ